MRLLTAVPRAKLYMETLNGFGQGMMSFQDSLIRRTRLSLDLLSLLVPMLLLISMLPLPLLPPPLPLLRVCLNPESKPETTVMITTVLASRRARAWRLGLGIQMGMT